jgi:hypothetical protein
VAAGKADGRVYVLSDDYYAVHDRPPGSPAPGAAFVLKGGQIGVFRRDDAAAARRDATIVGPVYAAPDGPLAVPTGLLFIRFAEGTSAAGRRAELERAGLEIVQIPGYAPHAAWVRARDGGIGASLEKVPAAEALPGVENVEPQMLMDSARR